MDERHDDSDVAKLENDLLTLINLTGVGPSGLGGDTTVLGVNVEYAHRHPASLPVGIAFQCWAARKAAAQISFDGEVKYLLHNVKET
jgi:fumarate hydratase subunit alpha